MGSRKKFEFLAGNLALDFVNTLDNRPTPSRQKENLESITDILQWGREAGVIRSAEPETARPLKHQSAQFVRSAILLREAIWGLFTAIARGENLSQNELDVLNGYIRETMSNMQLVRTGGRLVWQDTAASAPERVLNAVTRAAADLLTSPQVAFVRECASGTCRWLFVDTSKNHQRRWCDMRTCGNRAKVRRFYAAKKPHGARSMSR